MGLAWLPAYASPTSKKIHDHLHERHQLYSDRFGVRKVVLLCRFLSRPHHRRRCDSVPISGGKAVLFPANSEPDGDGASVTFK